MFQSAENRVSQSSHLMDDQPWSTPLKPRNSNLPDMDARRSCSSPPGYKLDKEANKDVGPTKMLARRVKNMSENSEATTLKGDDTTVAATGTVPKIPHPARTVASSASMRSATPVDRALVPLKRPEIQLHVTGTQGGQDLSVKPGNVSLEDRECEWPLYRSYHVINKDDETTWPPKNVLLQDWHILVIMRVGITGAKRVGNWKLDFNNEGLPRAKRKPRGRAGKIRVGSRSFYAVIGKDSSITGGYYQLQGDEGHDMPHSKSERYDKNGKTNITTGSLCRVQEDFIPDEIELLEGIYQRRYPMNAAPSTETKMLHAVLKRRREMEEEVEDMRAPKKRVLSRGGNMVTPVKMLNRHHATATGEAVDFYARELAMNVVNTGNRAVWTSNALDQIVLGIHEAVAMKNDEDAENYFTAIVGFVEDLRSVLHQNVTNERTEMVARGQRNKVIGIDTVRYAILREPMSPQFRQGVEGPPPPPMMAGAFTFSVAATENAVGHPNSQAMRHRTSSIVAHPTGRSVSSPVLHKNTETRGSTETSTEIITGEAGENGVGENGNTTAHFSGDPADTIMVANAVEGEMKTPEDLEDEMED